MYLCVRGQRSCICVLKVSILPLSMILIFHFRIVPIKCGIFFVFDINYFNKVLIFSGKIRQNDSFLFCLFVCLIVFNATFNNISIISWRSVLLVEETGVPGENHFSVAIH